MFNHFRTYYPQSNLISELVKIDRGQYIVRAIATANNITLATSFGTAATIEQAEDIARARLLAFMDIPPADASSVAQQATPHKTATPASPPPEPPPVVKKAPPEPDPTPVVTAPPPEPTPVVTEPSPEPEPTPVVKKAPPEPDPTPVIVENFNFDEAIAQTDVELKRLGWSKIQGRDYLQKTYGADKVARKDLTAEELTSFLEYLRELPNPSETVTSDSPAPSLAAETPSPAASPSVAEALVDPNFNFPETMSQINLEKKRLGWTKGQEQDYLLETYGKRSRQLLMDQELAEYWDYLRSLPG